MKLKIIKLTEAELTDIYHGLIIAMKELDHHRNGPGSDGLLADRLETIVKKIETLYN
ncbi:hypothetical protein WH221_14320 [Chryseobacterium culicis]|uniref:hypothetical protein n=1 Tax=Chryseobacterium TaxID=59732 RepID=UPI0013FD3295|nr:MULTISPECIES: hypothetical protein [Chryseobacterium]WES96496.1 hypothetical protein P2W68_16815 [Chryseobacterium arthrosphaerae]